MKINVTRNTRIKAIVLLLVLVSEIVFPLGAYALTGGPSQPEVESFEPVGTSEMVDIFSGDFNYNIPLLDVNGYPINLAYHAGATMDQEASWVGLGWNINPGTINRDMRGLPDDMNGEQIEQEINLKDNWTIGVSAGAGAELFGYGDNENASLGVNFGVKYNSYKGIGYDYGLSMAKHTQDAGLTAGLNLGYSDDGGAEISPNFSSQSKRDKNGKISERKNSFNIGASFSSQGGLESMNLGSSRSREKAFKQDKKRTHEIQRSNAGITYSTALSSYSPGISTPMRNESINLSFKPGGPELYAAHAYIKIGGYFSNQYIPSDDKKTSKSAYGYLYEQEASQSNNMEDRDYLLDFNRINETQLTKIQPYLGWVNHTYDMYSVAAQGVGGTYRLHRNDIPVLHDDYREAKSNGYRLGLELGVGNSLKKGVNLGYNHTGSRSGLWSEDNALKDKIGFMSKSTLSTPEYEPVYFREVNELVPQNQEYLNLVNNDEQLAPKLAGHSLAPYMTSSSSLIKSFSNTKSDNVSKERTKRNKLMTYRTASEAHLCLDVQYKSVSLNTTTYINGQFTGSPIDRENVSSETNTYNSQHISEVSILNSDGSQHIFGIPAYNNQKVEKSFRVNAAATADKNRGEVTYDTDDNTLKNEKGIDHYYSSKKMPRYVHSYLLTGVLSPDYVDQTGNGISDDDLGSAVKMNYTRVYSNYQWRAPYGNNKAKYSEGLSSTTSDDAGSYVYGQKEMWYMHSIEGKTHVAVFKISKRDDGLGVNGENGSKNTSQESYKLDKIELYSKRELQVDKENAVPIKTVHFEYSYELCPGVENQLSSNNGKLTLKKVYFTYGKSKKGKFNAYKFGYYNEGTPTYHLGAYDAWGNYAPFREEDTYTSDNSRFPYTTQNQEDANKYASMWNLNRIDLPSGGVINIEFEADDYGYVQNKRAMRMMKIKEFGRRNEAGDGFLRNQALYTEGTNKEHNDHIFFELEAQLPENEAGAEIIRNEYLEGINYLQATLYLDINNGTHEYVKTYVEPFVYEGKVTCGVIDGGTTGWVKINKVHIKDNNQGEMVNPIAKAGWQFTRLNLNHMINPSSNNKESGVKGLGIASSLLGFVGEMANMAAGPNKMLQIRKFCRTFEPSKSWIRLNDPDRTKIGGGHRVKQITMNDQWASINKEGDAKSAEYGQQYDYTMSPNSTSSATISSGVATFEPSMGRDENPFVIPEYYDQKRKGVPDIQHTFEQPIGENFYPGASVGYSKVTVRSIDHLGQSKQHRTGYQVSEFFTYKDYPTKSYATSIETKFFDPPLGLNILGFGASLKKGTAAQGYTVELNDMHGKPSSNWSYDENGVRLSGVKYEYQVDENGELDSDVLAIDPKGNITTQKFGVNVDVATDARFARDNFYSGSLDINLDVFIAPPIPIPAITLYPAASFARTVTRTATSTKIIRKTGLLKKTIAYKEGSQIETENLLYDGQTGEIVLTSVQNEFNNKIYSFNYPAHWAYDDGMGQAFQNWGLEFKGIRFNSNCGLESMQSGIDLKDYLVPGDVCILKNNPERNSEGKANEPLWINYGTNNELVLIDKSGHLWCHPYDRPGTSLQIIRSGRKNMANVSIGSVTTMKNPLSLVGSTYSLSFSDVLATSAVEYKDEWRTDMSLFVRYECDTIPSAYYTNTINLINAYIADTAFGDYYKYSKINVCHNNSYGGSGSPSDWEESHGYKAQQELTKLMKLNHAFSNNYTWEINTSGDTIGMQSNCKHDVSNFFYKRNGSGFSPKNNSIFNSTTTYAELDLSDSTFLYDSVYSRYVGISDWEILAKLPSSIYRYLNKVSNIDANLKNQFIQSSNIDFGATCSSTKTLDFRKLSKTDYQIHLGTTCLNDSPSLSCDINLLTNKIYVKNINSMLSHQPVTNSSGVFVAEVELHNGTIDTINIDFTSDCGLFTECVTICKFESKGQRVNPFLTGLRGNWRPYKSWTFVEDRKYESAKANPELDGAFLSYTPFWNKNTSNGEYKPQYANNEKWVWTSEVTEYSPFGMELENKDPLGRYSSAMYGYAQTLPIAVASNTRHRQLWYEGFEEYTYLSGILGNYICPPWQYAYTPDDTIHLLNNSNNLDNTKSHSGNMSLKLNSGNNLVQEIALNPSFVPWTATHGFTGTEFITTEDDQIVGFRPDTGKYVLSAWVSESGNPNDTAFETTYTIVEFESSGGLISRDTFRPKGLIIDGWQRIEEVLLVPTNATVMRVTYESQATTGWFDDFRIFPYHGSMKSYAYDFRTLRLMAELDENNYATFYEYDLEGNLIRIKKETERGVKSLQESRQHQRGNTQ